MNNVGIRRGSLLGTVVRYDTGKFWKKYVNVCKPLRIVKLNVLCK